VRLEGGGTGSEPGSADLLLCCGPWVSAVL
jgi:hypothetical protein